MHGLASWHGGSLRSARIWQPDEGTQETGFSRCSAHLRYCEFIQLSRVSVICPSRSDALPLCSMQGMAPRNRLSFAKAG